MKIVGQETLIDGQQVNAVVELQPGDITLHAEIKKWAPHKNLGAIIQQIQKLPGNALLVADYINPNMAKALREQNIQFMDTAGNIFINQLPVYLHVTGKKFFNPTIEVVRDNSHRAFEPKGLVVTYAFLVQPELTNAPYRTIAETTGVALGTVGWVIKALKAGGFLKANAQNNQRRITNYAELMKKWVEAWPLKLKPKQLIGEFVATEPRWHEMVDIACYEAYWGGEIAAEHYTNYLKPQNIDVYLRQGDVNRFIREGRLKKRQDDSKEHGRLVNLHTPFWTPKLDEMAKQDAHFVHPLLAYADLLASGNPRNIETADLIYEDRIAGYIG